MEVEIYPNPSKGTVTITSEKEINQINIYNLEGKLIHTTLSKSFEITSSGVYFINVNSKDGNYTIRKIVIQ